MKDGSERGIGARFAGGVLLVAVAIMFTGVIIGFVAPSLNDAPPFVTDDVEAVSAAIAGNPTAWIWANSLIAGAAVVAAIGLVPLSLSFEGNSRPWALMGLVAYAIGAVVEVIDRSSVGLDVWAAERYPDPNTVQIYEAFTEAQSGLGSIFYMLAFVALGLYGMALMQRDDKPGRGWAFLIGSAVAILIEVFGAGIPAFIYFGVIALGVVAWGLDSTEDRQLGPGGSSNS